jgi:hypothetical protein
MLAPRPAVGCEFHQNDSFVKEEDDLADAA